MTDSYSPDEKPSRHKSEEGSPEQDEAESCTKNSSDNGRVPSLKPVAEKIGEDSGNLRRRENWYRRRSGAI